MNLSWKKASDNHYYAKANGDQYDMIIVEDKWYDLYLPGNVPISLSNETFHSEDELKEYAQDHFMGVLI